MSIEENNSNKDNVENFGSESPAPERNESSPDDNTPADDTLEYVPFSDEIEDEAVHAQKKSEKIEPTEEQVRIQLLEDQLERVKDQMIRALAEAENTRKRAMKEREDASKFAVSSFSRDLLSVADNLRRALDAVSADILETSPQVKNLSDGVEATERELLRSFEKNGIVKIEPLDEKFDPNFHEVMFEAPMPDKEAGTIIQVIEPGYMIHERILRPARVGIAKGAATPQPPPESGHAIDTQV